MNFSEAYGLMQEGKKVKLPSWGGYWVLENNTIMMHCKDGEVIDMFDSTDKLYTLSHISSNEWIEATQENTPIMGGHIMLTFTQALKYLMEGYPMRRQTWCDGSYIYWNDKINLFHECHLPRLTEYDYLITIEDLNSSDWEFHNDKGVR